MTKDCHCGCVFLAGMNPMTNSRNCTCQQSSVNCRDQCVCTKVSATVGVFTFTMLCWTKLICWHWSPPGPVQDAHRRPHGLCRNVHCSSCCMPHVHLCKWPYRLEFILCRWQRRPAGHVHTKKFRSLSNYFDPGSASDPYTAHS